MFGAIVLGQYYAGAAGFSAGIPPSVPEGRRVPLYARSGIARSNATRSNYIRPNITVLLTKYRYPDPPEIVDVSPWTRVGTLQVSQALNDEPDQCSLTLTPLLPDEHLPQPGDNIDVGLATEGYWPGDPLDAYAKQVKADGAVAYWRLQETSGAIAHDSAGTFHGAIRQTVPPVYGVPGPYSGTTALRFNGTTTTGITIPNGAYSAWGTGPATLECWVRYIAPLPATSGALIDTKTGGGIAPSGLNLLSNHPNGNLYAYLSNGTTLYATNAPGVVAAGAADGLWRHVVVVLDRVANTWRIYVNGVPMGTPTAIPAGTNVTSTNPTYIGGEEAGLMHAGDLAECAVYHTALTQAQIVRHYQLALSIRPRETRIAAGLEFAGPIVISEYQRRQMNETPWVNLQCADWQYWFDAQLVNWIWPRQSATETIRDLLSRYVNFSQIADVSLLTPFTMDYVAPDLPECSSFTAINWRPSDVMRHLLTDMGGGWFIDALRRVHCWAETIYEPHISNPRPLTNYLSTLKTFRHRYDVTQLRRRVIVEGMGTTITTDVPTLSGDWYGGGIPVEDVRPFWPQGRVRLGAQWAMQWIAPAGQPTRPIQPSDQNPSQAHATQEYSVGDPAIYVDNFAPSAWGLSNAQAGWIKVNEQFIRYESAGWVGGAYGVALYLSAAIEFGKPIAPIKAGEAVTWVPWIDTWAVDAHTAGYGPDNIPASRMPVQATPSGSDVVLIADAVDPDANQPWAVHLPPLEALVQDDRYVYSGATSRAASDLTYFRTPLLTAEWETTDFNARPGRSQVIHLGDAQVLNAQLRINSVTLSFPKKDLAPTRQCTASTVKAATLLDVLTTDQA
jgi:hypothetical protein